MTHGDQPANNNPAPTARDTAPNPSAEPTWSFRIFIDGGCPLCAREASLMEKLDKGRREGRPNLDVVDIAAPNFEPARFEKDGKPLTYQNMMATIHGQFPSGTVISGLEVFRQTYDAVGWGWLLNWTRLPVIRPIAEKAYDLFAKHRLRITGRNRECPVPSAN